MYKAFAMLLHQPKKYKVAFEGEFPSKPPFTWQDGEVCPY